MGGDFIQQTLIVGFGRAGKELHLPCVKKMQETSGQLDSIVGVVDLKENLLNQSKENSGIIPFEKVGEVRGFDLNKTVVHICTDPNEHLATLKEALQAGFKNFIIEKPLVADLRELGRFTT